MVDTSTQSAEIVVPLVLSLVSPKSVVDVGCGEGKWLSVFKRLGVKEIYGVDGAWVKKERLAIPPENFESVNLEKQINLNRVYDLAVTLEVAEHLHEEYADNFVSSLVNLAPVVLFSAAIPLQGGDHHVNEQWPEYWAEKFAHHGYVPVDPIRRHIWGDSRVSFFYQQNILMFVKESELPKYQKIAVERASGHGKALSLVHPFMFDHYAKRWRAIEPLLWKLPLPLIKWAKKRLQPRS